MASNEPKQQEQPKQQPQKRPSRKSLFDSTNILGGALWFASALFTAVALLLVFVTIPPQCLGARGQITGCFVQIASSTEGIAVEVGALFAQLLITVIVSRIRNPSINHIGNAVEWFINFIGIYWIICVQIGAAPGVYNIVTTMVKNFTVPTLLWLIVMIVASISIDILTHNYFNAPSNVASAPQQRR